MIMRQAVQELSSTAASGGVIANESNRNPVIHWNAGNRVRKVIRECECKQTCAIRMVAATGRRT